MPQTNETQATFPCTVKEFNATAGKFFRAVTDPSNTQEGIANMYKGLVLHYLGIQNPTDEELERAATVLEVMTTNATLRGWNLQ